MTLEAAKLSGVHDASINVQLSAGGNGQPKAFAVGPPQAAIEKGDSRKCFFDGSKSHRRRKVFDWGALSLPRPSSNPPGREKVHRTSSATGDNNSLSASQKTEVKLLPMPVAVGVAPLSPRWQDAAASALAQRWSASIPNDSPTVGAASAVSSRSEAKCVVATVAEGTPTPRWGREKADLLQKVMCDTVEDVARRFAARAKKAEVKKSVDASEKSQSAPRTSPEIAARRDLTGGCAPPSSLTAPSDSLDSDEALRLPIQRRAESAGRIANGMNATARTAADYSQKVPELGRLAAESGQAPGTSPAGEASCSSATLTPSQRLPRTAPSSLPISPVEAFDNALAGASSTPFAFQMGRPHTFPSQLTIPARVSSRMAPQAPRGPAQARAPSPRRARAPSPQPRAPSPQPAQPGASQAAFPAQVRATSPSSRFQPPERSARAVAPVRQRPRSLGVSASRGGAGSTSTPSNASPSNPSAHRRSGSIGPLRPRSTSAERRATSTERQATMSPRGVRPRSHSSSRRPPTPPLQERVATAMQAVAHGMEPPGASDKWRVLQIFHEGLPRSKARVERIDRVVEPWSFGRFVHVTGSGDNAEACGVGFYAPKDWGQLARICSTGFQKELDFEELPDLEGFGIPVATAADLALERRGHADMESGKQGMLCIVLCGPNVGLPSGIHLAGSGGSGPRRERCVANVEELLVAHVIHFCYSEVREGIEQVQLAEAVVGRGEAETDSVSPVSDQRKKLLRQQKYAKARDPLVKAALDYLQGSSTSAMGTVLLPGTSPEAEAVVSLYLLGGGAARTPRPPGVNLREALGGVVVQRIENHALYQKYMDIVVESPDQPSKGGPRYREDVVWHGTRLKRCDEAASLADKLQSIAEQGFDPHRCIKGATAEGGIWVATSPMESFGLGCDGLVAFILCLAKTNFNEWVDASCARVLQRERVLPLYSLVHA